jgi:hypothetical protein
MHVCKLVRQCASATYGKCCTGESIRPGAVTTQTLEQRELTSMYFKISGLPTSPRHRVAHTWITPHWASLPSPASSKWR